MILVIQFLFILILPFNDKRVHSQGSSIISFSPNSPLCIGEEVEMVCFVQSTEPFALATVLVSINSSARAFTIVQLNTDGVRDGIDLSLYRANTDELSISTSRPGIRVIIRSYQPSDSNTIFQCHGIFPNTSLSAALASGQPMQPAVSPPAPSMLSISSSNIDPNTCSATISLNWIPPSSTDRPITSYYLSLQNRTRLESISAPANSYSHNTNIILDTVYAYSVSASSCAGNSTAATSNMNLINSFTLVDTSPNLVCLDFNNVTNMFTLNWGLSTEFTPLLIQYSLRYNYSHSQGNILISTIDNIANFSLLSSSAQTYTQSIAPHSFTCATDVETSVVACLRINEQCGQPSNEEVCCSITSRIPAVPTIIPLIISSSPDSKTPYTTLSPTSVPAFTTTSGNETISAIPTCTMIASSPLIIAIAIIGLLLFIAVIIIVMLLFVIIYLARKVEQFKSASKPAPSHPYEYIDLDKVSGNISSPTQQQSPQDYVHMSSVHKQDSTQPPPFYANLK